MNVTKPRVVITDWTFTILSMKIVRVQETNGSVGCLKRPGTFPAARDIFLPESQAQDSTGSSNFERIHNHRSRQSMQEHASNLP